MYLKLFFYVNAISFDVKNVGPSMDHIGTLRCPDNLKVALGNLLFYTLLTMYDIVIYWTRL